MFALNKIRRNWRPLFMWTMVSVSGLVLLIKLSQHEHTNHSPVKFHHSEGNKTKYFSVTVQFQLRQPEQIQFLVEPKLDRGQVGRQKLLIMVNSRPADVEVRESIRANWAGNASISHDAMVVFVLCNTSDANVAREADKFNDLIVINVEDGYFSLEWKTLAMLEWASLRWSEADVCLLKTDSDVVVFVENLSKFCVERLKAIAPAIYGCCWTNAVVTRNSGNYKWDLPYYVFPQPVYPTYCSGSGYLLVGKVTIDRLLSQIGQVPWPTWWKRNVPEDALFTGIMAKGSAVPRIHTEGFNSMRVAISSCDKLYTMGIHGNNSKVLAEKTWIDFQSRCRPSQ